jgi:hypothetical protein
MLNKNEKGPVEVEKHIKYEALVNGKEGTLKLNQNTSISEVLDLGI